MVTCSISSSDSEAMLDLHVFDTLANWAEERSCDVAEFNVEQDSSSMSDD
jgi:hypothetical protein